MSGLLPLPRELKRSREEGDDDAPLLHTELEGAAAPQPAAKKAACEPPTGFNLQDPCIVTPPAVLLLSELREALGAAGEPQSHELIALLDRLMEEFRAHRGRLLGSEELLTAVSYSPWKLGDAQASIHAKAMEMLDAVVVHVSRGEGSGLQQAHSQRLHHTEFICRHMHLREGGAYHLEFQEAEMVSDARVDRRELIALLASLLSGRREFFPWKKHHHRPQAPAMMAALRKFRYTLSHEARHCTPKNINFFTKDRSGRPLFPLNYSEEPTAFLHAEEDYFNMDVLCDFYQEEARLVGKRSDAKVSPLEAWESHQVVASALENSLAKHRCVDAHKLREEFWGLTQECTQFKPSLAVAVFQRFKAKRVLDMSAGWGDRLAGAIAADLEEYHAFDPNTSLKAGHDEIARRFVPEDMRERFRIEYRGFEEVSVQEDHYDLFFTSPPFFDFEVYTSIPGQSVEKFSSLDSWLVDFLFLSLRKAWAALKSGGKVVVHITDVFKTRVCEEMCLFIQAFLPSSEYRGLICSYGDAKKARPMWVFEKNTAQRDAGRLAERREDARRAFEKHHPANYRRCLEKYN